MIILQSISKVSFDVRKCRRNYCLRLRLLIMDLTNEKIWTRFREAISSYKRTHAVLLALAELIRATTRGTTPGLDVEDRAQHFKPKPRKMRIVVGSRNAYG